ncbi:MAG: MotA/TolQ/ExbB proton channel family protein [Rickettsiales bacterium]|jgi:chemotaxis protein MotA
MSSEAKSKQNETTDYVRAPSVRSIVDVATVFGIVGAFALIITAIVLGGSPYAFIDIPSICIVIGGTLGITTACYSFRDLGTAFRIVMSTVFYHSRNPSSAALHVLQLAELSRRKGLLAMEPYVPRLMNEEMLHKGLKMLLDGSTGDEIERIMHGEIQAAMRRHVRTVNVLRKAAEVSPAMGLIGTLVGLVQMLGNLSDPSAIGPSMAVALLTTFYGAILANMVFSPLAAKLERNSSEEALINQIHVMAATSIGRHENPRRLEMLLNTILPPDHRIEYFG